MNRGTGDTEKYRLLISSALRAPLPHSLSSAPSSSSSTMIATAAFPFVSSSHRPRLRPSLPRRAVLLHCSASSSSRWRAERESLLAEIAALRLRLGALEEGPRPLPAVEAAVASPAPAPAPDVSAVPPPPAPMPAPVVEEVEVRKEVVVVEEKKDKAKSGGGSGRRTLRVGAEGEDVRAMQEALEKLGYYSGEEEMEFSSFSSGTERTVKTWQATVGISEDGIMTSALLDRLFTGHTRQDVRTKDDINGAAIPAVTEIAEVQLL